MKIHPKGTRARVLLTSVFGPYAQDDEFGSRSINPMELYHNQVTRAQGAFSLRMFHRSWGIMMIQAEHFGALHGAGLSDPRSVRARACCERLRHRRHLLDHRQRRQGARDVPHGAQAVAALHDRGRRPRRRDSRRRDDDRCRPHRARRRHPLDARVSGRGRRGARFGIRKSSPASRPASSAYALPDRKGATAATIIPSVGCPMGCNFCTTSAFFGGKGKFLNFYETGDELFDVMSEMEASLKVQIVLHHGREFPAAPRARHGTAGPHERSRQELGTRSILLGQRHPQVHDAGTGGTGRLVDLDGAGVAALPLRQAEGHRHSSTYPRTARARHSLLGSTIVGLEHHTPENIREEIEHAVAHRTDFHQFMLYTPVPGTPLYHEMSEQGRMLDDVDLADIHGQHKFNFQHAAISREDSKRFLDWAFQRDFERNGPSLYRICRTTLQGWRRYKRLSRRACSGALRPRVGEIAHRLQRGPLGDGKTASAK